MPRHELKHQFRYTGELEVKGELEDGYNRVVQLARFTTEFAGAVMVLLDAQLVWMNEDRFTLKGVEKVKTDRGVVEYAQSWLLTLAPLPAPDDTPPEFNRRRKER